jgi:hypothetical protein
LLLDIALRAVGDVFVIFNPALAYNLYSPPAKGMQGPIPEEMSLTLLTNKKRKKPRINREKLEHLKNEKKRP